jgi:diacylglycerol kinase
MNILHNLLSKISHAFDGLAFVLMTDKTTIYLFLYFIFIGGSIIVVAPNITIKLLIGTLILLSYSIHIIITAIRINIDHLNNLITINKNVSHRYKMINTLVNYNNNLNNITTSTSPPPNLNIPQPNLNIPQPNLNINFNHYSSQVKDVISGALLWWHIIVLIVIVIVAVRTRYDYSVWSGDFPDLTFTDYIEQTFQFL